MTTNEGYSIAAIVSDFDRNNGDEDVLQRLVSQWPNDVSRSELHRALWCVRFEKLSSNDDLAAAIKAATEGLSPAEAQKLCGQFYRIACEQRRELSWKVFADSGFSWDELKLRYRHSAVCLGSELDNRFRIDRLLAAGSFGAIFSALDSVTNTTVAVKSSCGLSSEERRQSASLVQLEAKCLRSVGGFGLKLN